MRKSQFVVVHESDQNGNLTVFNLDNFAQFERYARSVEATYRKTHYRYPDLVTQRAGEGKVHYVSLYTREGAHGSIGMTAQLATRHAQEGPCMACDRDFDSSAGNGTPRIK